MGEWFRSEHGFNPQRFRVFLGGSVLVIFQKLLELVPLVWLNMVVKTKELNKNEKSKSMD